MMKHYKLICILICSLTLADKTWPDQDALTQQCLENKTDARLQVCKQAARSIYANEDLLMYLGQQLESQMRFETAVAVYELGSQKNSHNKSMLRGLIRARAAWRKQKDANKITLTESIAVTSTKTQSASADTCYRLRYQQALDACQTALDQSPDDADLHERLGDVLKSMGRKQAASLSYQASLRINSNNVQLRKKLDALVTIASNTSTARAKTKLNNHVNQTGDLQKNRLNPRAYSVAAKQIELLDRLLKQKILSQEDYDYEMRAVLSQAESINKSQATVPADVNKVVHKKLQSIGVGNYYGLIIGNNNYESRDYPDLVTAVNDAKKIDSILKNKYGFKTTVLLDADRYSILNAVSSLRRTLNPEDKLLIYYAGHGILDETTNQGYWLPVDAEPQSIANWISANDITDALIGINAQHALVIADSCFSASLLRGVNQSGLDEQDALLVRLNSKRSRTVLTSGGLEPVQDDGGGEHSVFANALISILEDNDGLLEAGKLFIQLRDRVILNADQTPQYAPIQKAGHDGGDFIFIPS